MRNKTKTLGVITGLWIVLTGAWAFAQQPFGPFQPVPFPPQLSPVGGEELIDPWGKFRITIPAGAIAQNETFTYVISGGTSGMTGVAGIWISITAIPDLTNFQTYSQQLSGMLTQTGWQIVSQTTQQVGQFQVQEITAKMDNPQMGGKIQMITAVIPQSNLMLSIGSPQQDSSGARSILDQMLRTLQVAGPPTPSGVPPRMPTTGGEPAPTTGIAPPAVTSPELSTQTYFELSKINLTQRASFISPVGDQVTSMRYPARWHGKPIYPSSPYGWMGLIIYADEQMLTHIAVGGQAVSGHIDPQAYLQQTLQGAGDRIRDFKVLSQIDLSEAYSMLLSPMRVQAIAFTYSCLYANTPVLGFTEIGVMTSQESYVLTPGSAVFTFEMQAPANLPPQELYQKVNTLMAVARSIESTSDIEEGRDTFKSAKGWIDTLGGTAKVRNPETGDIYIVDDKYEYYYYQKGEEWKIRGTNDPWGFQGPDWVKLPKLP
ncbi:MAG: hypothetical protein ACE5K3_01480 [bacterium]